MKPSVCLAMIVKNESHIIERCLESLKDHISYWVIADTGSTDETPKLIQETLAGIPGELHHDAWQDFSHNRNLVHVRAVGKADWVLSHDADDILEGDFSDLTDRADAFGVHVFLGAVRFVSPRLFSGGLPWRFVGEQDEHMEVGGRRIAFCKSAIIHSDGAGSRHTSEQSKEDARVLRGMPRTPRNVFNLGQRLRDAGEIEEAIKCFDERVAMGDWEEERWMAAWYAAELDGSPERMVQCIRMDPKRAEPYYWLAVHHKKDNPEFAHMFAHRAARLRIPKRVLSIRYDIYRWLALELCSELAWKVDDNETAAWASRELLGRDGIPVESIERARRNLEIIEEHLEAMNGARERDAGMVSLPPEGGHPDAQETSEKA